MLLTLNLFFVIVEIYGLIYTFCGVRDMPSIYGIYYNLKYTHNIYKLSNLYTQ